MLPGIITDELIGLQDQVRPKIFSNIRRVIDNEVQSALGRKVVAAFAFFSLLLDC